MKLIQLKNYVQNSYDKEIINRMTKDNESNLNNYIISVISELLKNIPIEDELKIKGKYKIENLSKEQTCKVSVYTSLIPYLQLRLKNQNDTQFKVTSYIEMLISYLLDCITEEEFNVNLLSIKNTLSMSEILYNELLEYFKCHEKTIKTSIIKNI